MNNIKPSRVVLQNVRLSYAHIWEPTVIGNDGGDPKYSSAILIPKSDTKTLHSIEKAVNAALEAGKAKFGGKIPPLGALKLPLRDGDVERDDAEAYQNMMFFNASSKTQPQIVDQNVQPILDQSEVYSGCWVNVSIEFYAFNVKGNRGVAASLCNIQKLRDDEPLGTAPIKAENDFTPVGGYDDDFLN